MTHPVRTLCLFAGAALAASALVASPAAAAPPGARTPCFFTSQWQGWSAPDARTLYLRVNGRDVYRVDLSGDSPDLQDPGVHLVFNVRGSSSVCTPLDLDLAVADDHGIRSPLIARSLTRLSPEEAAAIPRKFQP